jgi:hypothetical protein
MTAYKFEGIYPRKCGSWSVTRRAASFLDVAINGKKW